MYESYGSEDEDSDLEIKKNSKRKNSKKNKRKKGRKKVYISSESEGTLESLGDSEEDNLLNPYAMGLNLKMKGGRFLYSKSCEGSMKKFNLNETDFTLFRGVIEEA